MLRHGFPAMGTRFELVLDAAASPGAEAALAAAEREVHRLEALLSRFQPGSELSRLNRERALLAGPELAEVVRRALAERGRTGGRFDPTLHDAVVAAGYDRSFVELPADTGTRTATVAVPALPAAGARALAGGGAVHVSADGRIVLDAGVRLDLGGIGKGYAAERAASLLEVTGPCLVDAGGDVATRGRAWPVGVAGGDGELLTLLVEDGGLATSGRDRRRWLAAGTEMHHIIDPRTGLPAEGDLLRVTVVAGDAVEAEARAKALFVAGAAAAQREADALGLPAVLVTLDGRTVLAGGIA